VIDDDIDLEQENESRTSLVHIEPAETVPQSIGDNPDQRRELSQPEHSRRSGHQPQDETTMKQTTVRRTAQFGRAGRSRFSTLNSDVESALSILYLELELSESLQKEVSGLQSELQVSRQEVQILKNQMAMVRKEAEAGTAELNRLKAELSGSQRASEEVVTLRAENGRLNHELNLAKRALSEKDTTLDAWKAKLKGLLDA
jgi:chromosome segregation ATPase